MNQPVQLAMVPGALEGVRSAFSAGQTSGKQVSLAELIVLAGSAAVEQAAHAAGYELEVAFTPGRTDASQDQTDIESFSVLKPIADGFRNYLKSEHTLTAEELLIDRAQLLTLSAPEMTVLVDGLRVLGANADQSLNGVFTQQPGVLTNDFFVSLLDMNTVWAAISDAEAEFVGRDRATDAAEWTGTRMDRIFGSNSQLRALQVYAQDDSKEKFAKDFVAAWTRVMNLDRFDLA